MAQMNPSPSKPVVRYPTALLEDKELITTHDTRLPDYKALEYGTPYPDQNKFPGLKLIFQEPLGEDDRMVRRVWAGDRQDQDLYNADRKYSGGSTEHPILVRRYLFPEEGYEPLPTGTPDSQFPEAVLVEEEVAQPENRNGYLAVTRVFETLPGPALSGVLVTDKGQVATITTQVVAPGTTVTPSALTVSASVKPDSKGKSVLEKVEVGEVFSEARFTAEKPEVVPTQFRAAVPEETTESVQIGEAEMPMLDQEGDKAASQEQLTKFTKRVRRVRRDLSNVSESLEETNVDEAGIVETITKTLKTGPQTVDPSATVRGQVEELGDGLTLKTEVEKAKIFGGKVLAAERPDPVPEKFRVAVPTKTVEETVPGTATDPVLVGGEIAESEQQVTEFTKRTRKVTRDTSSLPKTLTQTATTNEGLKAAVSETLQTGDTTATPSAKVSIESEAIGDGTYVVRTTTLPEVFDAKSFAIENPDPVPPKFRISAPSTTTEEIVEGTASQPTLAAGELAAAEQQVTKHTKRTRKTSRASVTLPKSFEQTATTNEGLKATITETLQSGNTTPNPSAKVSVESEALGDGNYIVRKTELPEVFPAKSLSVENPDPVPQKFRIAVPATTTEETEEGDISTTLTLGTGELSKAEQQVTKFTKRTRKTSRPTTGLPKSLVQTATTNEGLKATVTETLQTGNTTDSPSAKVTIESEAMGDGTYVVRKTEVPEIFSAKAFSIEKPDNIPVEFRAQKPAETEEKIEEGDAEQVVLSGDQIAKSEQQITKFTKRVRVTKRDLTTSATLEGEQIDQDGIKVTVTRTLADGAQSVTPSATVSGQVEDIGDGKTIKTELVKDELFDRKSESRTKTDAFPLKFRAAVPALEEQQIEEAAALPVVTTLAPEELQLTHERVTKHTIRKIKVTRPVDTIKAVTLTGKQTGQWGVETVEQKITESDEIVPGFGVKEAQTEAIDKDFYLKTTQKFPETPAVLKEYRVDEETGIVIEVEKTLVDASAAYAPPPFDANTIIERQALDKWHSIQIVSKLSGSLPPPEVYYKMHPITLPDRLEEVGVYWDKEPGVDFARLNLKNPSNYPLNLAWNVYLQLEVTGAVSGAAYTKIKNGFRGKAQAKITRKFFREPPTAADIPSLHIFKPVVGQLILRNSTGRKLVRLAKSGSGLTELAENPSTSSSIRKSTSVLSFGPVEHSNITRVEQLAGSQSVSFTGSFSGAEVDSPELQQGPTIESIKLDAFATGNQTPAGFSGGGGLQAVRAGVEVQGVHNLVLPASSTPLAAGSLYVEDAEVSKWRFGIWVQEIIEVIVPAWI